MQEFYEMAEKYGIPKENIWYTIPTGNVTLLYITYIFI